MTLRSAYPNKRLRFTAPEYWFSAGQRDRSQGSCDSVQNLIGGWGGAAGLVNTGSEVNTNLQPTRLRAKGDTNPSRNSTAVPMCTKQIDMEEPYGGREFPEKKHGICRTPSRVVRDPRGQ